ncbi:MAG: amidohydrolase [Nocardioidaceae bacterium]|nr:amidohydrolase [Nocardioidaceae bacterium]
MIDLIELRRALHRMPELALDLPRTRQAVLDALAPLDLETHTSDRCSSVSVVIPGAGPGPTVLLRADMDGLPVVEASGEPFSSENGAMHACGHDLHMAGLVGAVHELSRRRAEFRGSVLAVFQPGEEGAGGAELMIEEKAHLVTGQRPLASYGVHVLSYAPAGTFFCREGEVMGAAMLFELELVGRGGHAARPHTALDPVSTAALVVQAIQTFVAQNSSPSDPIVVTVGAIEAGTAANVIPNRALLKVSLRATSSATTHAAFEKIRGIAQSIAQGFGLELRSQVGPDLGPTVADASGAALVRGTVTDLFGEDRFSELVVPEMISEDFSLFLDETGGAFVLVGAALPGEPNQLPTNHSPEARFDDSVVPDITSLLSELAIRRLNQVTDGTEC